jgi:hypothetical protein
MCWLLMMSTSLRLMGPGEMMARLLGGSTRRASCS